MFACAGFCVLFVLFDVFSGCRFASFSAMRSSFENTHLRKVLRGEKVAFCRFPQRCLKIFFVFLFFFFPSFFLVGSIVSVSVNDKLHVAFQRLVEAHVYSLPVMDAAGSLYLVLSFFSQLCKKKKKKANILASFL